MVRSRLLLFVALLPGLLNATQAAAPSSAETSRRLRRSARGRRRELDEEILGYRS